MAHPKARLNVLGRQLLVRRVRARLAGRHGLPMPRASAGRPRTSGSAGSATRVRPVSPTGAPNDAVRRGLRQPRMWPGSCGPDRVALGARSTGTAPPDATVDRRRGPPPRRGAPPRRPRPADGAAHPAVRGLPSGCPRPPGPQEARPDPRRRRPPRLGRSTETRRLKHGGLGYDHFEVVVDDRSRRSVVVQVPDESGASAAAALQLALAAFEADGIAVERVMTDNAWAYRGREYRRSWAIGARPEPDHTGRRPTARPSASSAPSSENGRTAGHTPPTPPGWPPCRRSSTSTITADRIPRSVASAPRPL